MKADWIKECAKDIAPHYYGPVDCSEANESVESIIARHAEPLMDEIGELKAELARRDDAKTLYQKDLKTIASWPPWKQKKLGVDHLVKGDTDES